MKKFKVLSLVFILAMLGLSACSDEETAGDSNDSNYERPVTLPDTIDPEDEEDWYIDWTNYDIIVNGVGVTNANHRIFDDGYFPTHIPLMPVVVALGFDGVIYDGNPKAVSLEGINGAISFVVGSYDFTLNDEVITLFHPSVEYNGDIYVPIPFFRAVFGAGNAGWMGGYTYIDTHAVDDMH